MQPYVIKQGDYLAALAHAFGFDPDVVWNDEKNASLRQARPNPNILCPTDVLYIPDQVDKPPATQDLETGTTNTFVSSAPTVTITIRFLDAPLASQGYSVQELPQLAGLTTGADGTATFSIPVTLPTFTVAFAESGTTFVFNSGHLDPIDTLSGIVQRLKNMGYLDLDVDDGRPDFDAIRAALRAFKAEGSAPSDGAATNTPTGSQPDDAQNDASGAPAPSDSTASSQGAADAPVSGADVAPPDDAGLGDDGKLDDATSKALLAAHGS